MTVEYWEFEGKVKLDGGYIKLIADKERILSDEMLQRFADESGNLGLLRVTVERIQEVGVG